METNVQTLPTKKNGEEAKPLIAKFQMSIKDASYHYHSWIDKKKFVHKDFDIAGNLKNIKGIWVPVWLFEVSAESSWNGEVSHNESRSRVRYNYSEKRDEHYEEDEEVWKPVSGTHYGDYLLPVSASRAVTQGEIEALKFNQLDLKNYDESYLDGWKVQATYLDKTEAKEICNTTVKALEKLACMHEVERLNGCSTRRTYTTSTFALLPVFVLSYTCNNEFYRNLINGITGEVYGNIPEKKVPKFLTNVVALLGFFIILIIIGGLMSKSFYFALLVVVLMFGFLFFYKPKS